MEVMMIYMQKRTFLKLYLPTEVSVSGILGMTDLNTTFYMTVRENDISTTLNLSLLLTETVIGTRTTWEEVAEDITCAILQGYESHIVDEHTTIAKRPFIHNLHSYDDVQLTYCSIANPYDRNIFQSRYKLHDIVITDSNKHFILENSLVTIGGQLLRPVVFDKELYCYNGAKSVWGASIPDTVPWPILIDTSPLGGHQIIKLNECSHRWCSPTNKPSLDTDVEVTFPESIDLNTKSVFLVVANKLHFPDEISVTGKRTVMFSPNQLNLETAILMQKSAYAEVLKDTTLYLSERIDEYATTKMWEADNQDSFFILINNPKLTISKHRCTPTPVARTLVIYDDIPAGGILIRKSTGAIVEYTQEKYSDRTMFYIPDSISVVRGDMTIDSAQIAAMLFDCVEEHHTELPMKDTAFSDYELVFISA